MSSTSYRIVNAAVGDDFFTNAGGAYDAQADFTDSKTPSVVPTINTGRSKNLYSNRTLLNASALGSTLTIYGSQVIGGNTIGYAAWGTTAVTGLTVAASSGYALYTKASHGLSVGDVINVTEANGKVDGPQRVVTVPGVNTFTTTKTYTSGADTNQSYVASNGTQFASMTAEKYVIRRVTDELAGGISNTTLRSGASDYQIRRSIHKLEHLYTTRTATAIRAGYWNEYSGTWSTTPTTADDISSFGTDEAATPTRTKPGELVYKEPKPIPVMDDYKAQTG